MRLVEVLVLDHESQHIAVDVDLGRLPWACLEEEGVTVAPVDHHVTKSLYFSDSDGNALELYADGSDDWKSDPDSLFAPARKLLL